MFEYKAEIVEVIDGDTITAKIDLGFHINWTVRLRLFGINTPEIRSSNEAERLAAQKSKDRLAELILGKTVLVKTYRDKTEKYGRYLAEINFETRNINQQLITESLAVPYSGGKR